MLNKPKFMRPSTNKEECTIDIDADVIPFSCIVDGNESVTHWQIVIYDIIDNDIVFDSDKTPLESSFYPVDEKNRNVAFEVDLKKHPKFKDSTDFKNRSETYYWTITLWGASECSTTSYQEVFYANTTPDISISYKYLTGENYIALSDKKEENTLASRACIFKAAYAQADGVQLKRYGWRITDTDSGQVFIDTITQNQIYGSADNIICTYNGFLNGGNYSVELFIETQNNKKITSAPFEFSVSYSSTFLSNDFGVETLKNEPAIMLNWDKALVISGVMKDKNNDTVHIDDTEFKENYPVEKQCSIKIPDQFKVVYDTDASLNFDIDENSYVAFSTQLLSDDEADLFFAEGADDTGYELKRKLSYIGNNTFRYYVVGYDVEKVTTRTTECKVTNSPSEYVWYNILMSPLIKMDSGEHKAELIIYESGVIGCCYPSEDLYPSEDFYPIFGKWNNLKEV